MIVLKNYAGSSLAVALGAAGTVAQVLTADAAKFPVLNHGDVFPARIRDAAGGYEYVLATARDGNQITILRGQEGTTARAFAAGASFELVVTARSWDMLAEGRWVRAKNAAGDLLPPTRVSATQFSLPGDVTALFVPNRALRLIQSATACGYVSGSVYSAGATTVTVQAGLAVDAGLTMAELGLEVEAAPKYGDAANADTLGGSTKAQVVAEALGGTAANSAKLEGKSKAEVVAESRSGVATLGDVNAYTKQNYAAPVAVTPTAGAVTLDANLHQNCKITSAQALTMNAPTNAAEGRTLFIRLYAATALGISWNGVFVKNADKDLPTAHIAGKDMYLQFYYDGANWVLLGGCERA